MKIQRGSIDIAVIW